MQDLTSIKYGSAKVHDGVGDDDGGEASAAAERPRANRLEGGWQFDG